MLKSIFFRRILSLLLLALLMWTMLTAVFYNFFSRPVFTRIKVSELLPKVQSIATMARRSGFDDNPYFDQLLTSAYEVFDSWIFVVDGISGEFRNTALPESLAAAEPEIREAINSQLSPLLDDQASTVWFTRILPRSHNELLFVGVPITYSFGLRTNAVGAVFFVKPLAELNAGLRSLNIALVTAALLVLGLIIGPAYWATALLIRPLRQTRDIAIALAEGNYKIRADVQQAGEIGELARSMNDLSERLAVTIAELTLERNRLRQIIDGMTEGIIAVDHLGQITAANRCVWQLLGRPLPLVATPDPAVFLTDEDLHDAFQEVLSEKKVRELTITAGERTIFCQIVPLSDGNGLGGAVALFRDITEAERLEQTRRDYVANISHELRTPLTAMRALIEPLREGMVSREEDRQRYFHILLRETIRLSRLIDDMLELSRLQAGTLALAMETLHLQALLPNLIQEYTPRAEDLGLTLLAPPNLADCPPVIGNHNRIEQVLVILLDNAMKFTEDGGSIAILLNWNEHQIQVSVTDTGSGIAPEDIEHVFDRFYKADKAHQQPGTGLGLSIAREIMQKMGQTIRVYSKPGEGATFTLTLERARPGF